MQDDRLRRVRALALAAQGRVLEALDAATHALGFVPDEPAFAGVGPQRLVEVIRREGIDILIDLKGQTEGALALRPAPIQVHYRGYPGTLGSGLADYLIGDDVVTPIAHAAGYAETLALLPGSYQINDRKRPIAEPSGRPALQLPAGSIVFCCFNNVYKLNPQVFDVRARIRPRCPIRCCGCSHVTTAIRRSRICVPKRTSVVSIRLASCSRGRPRLGLYRHADLFLDTWPYNPHTTASDALWAGYPSLTLRGETFAGRVAASLLTAIGLPELIADSVAAYEEKALALARNSNERRRLRAFLAGPGRSSKLFDTARTTATLEAAYLMMADQYRRRVREPFRVQPAP